MPFYEHLVARTAPQRQRFMSIPVIQRALAGQVSRTEYQAYLAQAYHHVKHTVPLLRACGARLPERLDWLREATEHYAEEEAGHEEWILDDIAAAGGDPEVVRHARPAAPTELMVACAYDVIKLGNPAGFFGMVYVLEGSSVALAHRAAMAMRESLGLPTSAFRYLVSHGSVDQEHIRFLQDVLDRFDDADDRQAVEHSATLFFHLYGDVLRSVAH